MPKTIVKSDAQKDMQRAEELLKAFAEFQKEKKAIQEEMNERLSPISASMNAAEKELVEIGERHKKAFDKDRNLVFDNGYLHIRETSRVVTDDKVFNMKKFISKYPDFVKTSFNVSGIKKALLDGDQRSKIVAHGVDLKIDKDIEVKVK